MARPRRYQIGGEDEAAEISRSQRKRESTALQELGEKLVALPVSKLAALPLPDDLREAVAAYSRLPTREAKRRQLQYVGRLMREAEEEGTLQAVLDAWAWID